MGRNSNPNAGSLLAWLHDHEVKDRISSLHHHDARSAAHRRGGRPVERAGALAVSRDEPDLFSHQPTLQPAVGGLGGCGTSPYDYRLRESKQWLSNQA